MIDPTLLYSTYLGGTDTTLISGTSPSQRGNSVAVDAAGNAYVAGYTEANDFPTTVGSLETSPAGQQVNAFVSKLNPLGSALVYSTYLCGRIESGAQGIAVDAAGEAYVAGFADPDFPVTANAFQNTPGPVFFTKLSATGDALVYSTFIGPNPNGGFNPFSGGAKANGIAIDQTGKAYVTGLAQVGFPTTVNGFQNTYPGGGSVGFVSVFDPSASGSASLLYST